LLIGLLDGVPVTGGAFRRFDADTVEFKRIWTNSGYRRRGYAKALLAELEATAAKRGYRRVYLITGNRQPEAEALYRTTGYCEIEAPTVSWGPFRPIAFGKALS
jgi:GNAT superfamily N-acetyltransferase